MPIAFAAVIDANVKVVPHNRHGRCAAGPGLVDHGPGVHHVETLVVVGARALVAGAAEDGDLVVGHYDVFIVDGEAVLALELVD